MTLERPQERGLCIHQRIDQQAVNFPDAVALVEGDRRLSYRELIHSVSRLAVDLRRRGVAPERFVGVCMDRSIDAAIALLGILKAGGAWVYLDPEYPPARIAGIVASACPVVTLAAEKYFGDLPTGTPLLRQRGVWADGASAPECADEPAAPDLDNAAYLLYTSGSTGKPKGAVEIHRCLTARLDSGVLPDLRETDVCAWNSSLGFGVTATRLMMPLALGATVVCISEADASDVHRLAAAVARHRISSITLPPVLLRCLMELPDAGLAQLGSLRAVSVTGSALSPELVRAFLGALPGTVLVNLYGGTEMGTTAALRIIQSTTDMETGSIGLPIPGTRIYLLDESLRPVDDGATGEICVSSAHLARGYRDLPELTAERFLADPFHAGARMYRTGDLGRRLPSGEIQLLGRRDHQVKVRGHRVELGEVETVLERHAAVAEAVVTLRRNKLIAYLAIRAGAEMDLRALRAWMRSELPDPMCPSAYVILPKIRRTAGGKPDRAALPPYDPTRPETGTPFVAPRTPEEAEVAAIWSSTLHIEQIGALDNFIELGGDSLAATETILQLERRCGRAIEMDLLFESTVEKLAHLLSL